MAMTTVAGRGGTSMGGMVLGEGIWGLATEAGEILNRRTEMLAVPTVQGSRIRTTTARGQGVLPVCIQRRREGESGGMAEEVDTAPVPHWTLGLAGPGREEGRRWRGFIVGLRTCPLPT